jgi:hypothetical protein
MSSESDPKQNRPPKESPDDTQYESALKPLLWLLLPLVAVVIYGLLT